MVGEDRAKVANSGVVGMVEVSMVIFKSRHQIKKGNKDGRG